MLIFRKTRWARLKKRWKENHATEVTKIPKTKRPKYGMNETLGSVASEFVDCETAKNGPSTVRMST